MSDVELETARASAQEVDTFGFRHETDDESHFMAVLLTHAIGHFRVIEHSGMNSIVNGAGNIGERLSPGAVSDWTTF
jgi:hypothetical protein